MDRISKREGVEGKKRRISTMIIYHSLYIKHDFGVSSMSKFGHLLDCVAACLKYSCRLGVKHEWDGKEAFDPFCKRVRKRARGFEVDEVEKKFQSKRVKSRN